MSVRNTYSRLFTLIRDLRILTECNIKPYFRIQSERFVVLVDSFVFSFFFFTIFSHNNSFLYIQCINITLNFLIFALDNNDLKSFKRCVLATMFLFISRLIAMVITSVTLEQNISHQLKNFILSPATTHFPLKKYRRSVIIFKNASEHRHYPI